MTELNTFIDKMAANGVSRSFPRFTSAQQAEISAFSAESGVCISNLARLIRRRQWEIETGRGNG